MGNYSKYILIPCCKYYYLCNSAFDWAEFLNCICLLVAYQQYVKNCFDLIVKLSKEGGIILCESSLVL